MINLCDNKTCTGCYSCYNTCNKNAITMTEDPEGFLFPVINAAQCVGCGACLKACPVITPQCLEQSSPKVYAGYILDQATRLRSSSGGMFSALAQSFFAHNDGKSKYVVAAEFDDKLVLRHRIVSSYDDISKMRGSKYVQSNIGGVFKKIKRLLMEGNKVLFCGTPCQVAGLNAYLHYQYHDNLYTIDLICHGVPSPKLFASYLRQLGVKGSKSYYDYWFRDFTSTGYFISSILTTSKRKKVSVCKHSYITAYLKSWLHRECCYNCQFNGIPRQADCTIGDFWGIISKKVPFKGERGHGISVILANTQKGVMMVDGISHITYLEEHSIDEAIVDNHNLMEADKRPKERDYIYKEFMNLPPRVFMKKYKLYLPHISFWRQMRSNVGKFLRRFHKFLKYA